MNTSFEPGAPAVGETIPLCVPEIRGNEWTYVKECLDTGWVSSVGEYVNRFEKQLAARAGTQYAVATSCGTAALHVALLVGGIQPGDEVIVPSLTFIAPVNAIRYVGAWPVFIDSEPDYWQLSPEKLQHFVEKGCEWIDGKLRNRATGRNVRAIVPVHILGHPVDMEPVLAIARKYNLLVIEDATESLGARYKEKPLGQLGDIACFSFNGNKLITTGGGGMLVTSNKSWAEKAKYLTTQAKDDPIEFIHGEIGYNYRLTNVQAAMGCAQLEQLDNYIQAKRSIAQNYTEALQEVPGITAMKEASWAYSVFWMFTILLDPQKSGKDSRALHRALNGYQVQTRPLWQPNHLSPAHRDCFAADCSNSVILNERAISLPCSVGLSAEQQSRVISAVREICKK